MMLYLAIDQHSKQLTTNKRWEDGEVSERRQVSTRWKDVRAFLEGVRQESEAEGGFMVILEVCGFNDWLLQLLKEYGARDIVLLHPEKKQRRKTDRRDANRLGELLWVNRDRLKAGLPVKGLRRVHIASAADQADRRLTSLRWQIGRERTRTLNRVRQLLRRHNLEHDCPTKGIQTRKARHWLKELALEPLDRWEMDTLLNRWQALDEEMQALEEKIRERQAQHPVAPLLATVPGLGAFGSLALACRMDNKDRFAGPRSLPNYWGLTPRCDNSGEVTQRLGSITKEGSALARFILGQVVVHVLRKDARLRTWYKGVRRRRGSKIARVAVMRRLASILWHMVKKQQPYRIGGLGAVSAGGVSQTAADGVPAATELVAAAT
jgi:transposase